MKQAGTVDQKVAYCNAYSQKKSHTKNRRYPQKSMFADTVGVIDVL
jgi:hypothetical protein